MIIFKIITEKTYCLCNKFRNEILLSIESLSHVKIQPEMGFQNVVLPLTTLLKRAMVTNLGYLFEMFLGKDYSLTSCFRYNMIEKKVTGIILSFDAQTSSHLHFHVLSCDRKTYPISNNKTGHVHHTGYEKMNQRLNQ